MASPGAGDFGFPDWSTMRWIPNSWTGVKSPVPDTSETKVEIRGFIDFTFSDFSSSRKTPLNGKIYRVTDFEW